MRIAGGQGVSGVGGTANNSQVGAAGIIGAIPLVAVGTAIAVGITPGAIGGGQYITHSSGTTDAWWRTVYRCCVGDLCVGRVCGLCTAIAIVGCYHHLYVFMGIAGGQGISGTGC